jgi:hypothetical protein
MAMNYASAVTMNNLVLALDQTARTVDMALASREYALSNNDVERNLQLLYGLSAIKSQNYNMVLDVLSFGKGLVKTTLSTTNIELPLGNEQGYTVQEVLGNIDTMSNGYIFGKIFLTSDSVDGEELIFSLARPINDPNGNPLIISKDIDIDTAEEIIRTSQELSYTTDKTYDLEIYKFIADVSYYDQTIKNSRVFFKLIDERLPRGYFGYTEENISKMVITSIIRNYALISELYNTQKRLTNEIISNWVGSSTWEPDFTSYWQNSEQILPSRLLSYLSSELSINI